MNTNSLTVAVVDGKTITESVELRSGQLGGPARIKSIKNAKYILADTGEKPVAPDNLMIKRVGNNLHVTTLGTDPDQPLLIIEEFYDSNGQLVGVGQDGEYYQYVASDAEHDHAAAFLTEGVSAPQVLGSQELPGFGSGLVAGAGLAGWFWPALLGLAAVGAVGAVVAGSSGGGGSNHDDGVAAVPVSSGIGGANDNVGSEQGPIQNGGSTDDTTPTFSGVGTPGNSVVIIDNGTVIGEVIIGSDGTWEVTPTVPLPEGDHSIVVVEKDPEGNLGDPSCEFDLVIDVTAPAKAIIGGATDDVGDQQGPIAQNTRTDDNTPTLTGTAEPGSMVEIFANGVRLGETKVNADGTWSYTTPEMADGRYSFTSVATDAAGNAGLPSDPFVFIIDVFAPVKPGIGTGGIELVDDNVAPLEGNIENGQSTNDTTPTFSGGGLIEGDKVSVIDNGVLLDTVIVGADGSWSFTPDPAFGEGEHSVVVVVTDPLDRVSEESDPYIVIVDTTAPVKPGSSADTGGIDEAYDNVDPDTGDIGNNGDTDDTTPTFSGSGLTPGDTVSIRDNGVELDSVTVAADGSWTYTPSPALTDGSHSIVVVVSDAAGNASEPSDPYIIHVDSVAPVAEAFVTSMTKDSGNTQFTTNDGTAGRLIQGTTTAPLASGESVQVSTDGGKTWHDAAMNAELLRDAGGTWSFIDHNSHSEDWEIHVRVVDSAGNATTTSQTVTLDQSIISPDTLAWNGTGATVTFDGSTLEVGDKVVLQFDGQQVEHVLSQSEIDVGTVTVVAPPLAGGATGFNLVSAALVDNAGNVSDQVTYSKILTEVVSENFNILSDFRLSTGAFIELANFRIDSIREVGHSTWSQGINNGFDYTGDRPASRALNITGAVLLTLKDGVTANTLSFSYGDLATSGPEVLTLTFKSPGMDDWIYLVDSSASSKGTALIELPPGMTYSSVEFGLGSDPAHAYPYAFVDDISFGDTTYEMGSAPSIPEMNQDITQSINYFGGDADNTFSLADVDVMNNAGTGIHGGEGTDTLALTGSGQTLDLGTLLGTLESIEIIDLHGSGGNTLNLSLGDVLELGETSLFTDDQSVQMVIKGGAGDVVNLDDLLADGTDPGDWAGLGQVTVEGVVYNVYQHSALEAQLLVQDGVTTNLV